jgi:sugar lactone lactonase YvrE
MRLRLLLTCSAIVLILAPLSYAAPGPSKPAHPCRPWRVRTLLSGQGWLESLAFDGRGGITISALSRGRILRLSRHGRLSVLLDHVNAPGGEIVRGRFLYFTTGDLIPPAPDGTIARLDLLTGKSTTWASGLTMPNGLAFLPNGDAVVSRDDETGPPPTDVTRISARNRRHPRFNWVRIPDTNGLAVDPSGRWLYVDRTFSKNGLVDRISIAHPRMVSVIGRLGAGVLPDDMTIDASGILYIAGFGSGKVYRLDPRTHSSCAIASGLGNPTAVVFGGHGWPASHLFVTDASGHLYELTPR